MTKLIFLIYVEIGRIEETPGTFYLNSYILGHIYHNEVTKENKNSWDDHCEGTYKLNRPFEDAMKFNWKSRLAQKKILS